MLRVAEGVAIAKYPDQATRNAATELSKAAFGKMIQAGIIDGDSIHLHEGNVVFSF